MMNGFNPGPFHAINNSNNVNDDYFEEEKGLAQTHYFTFSGTH